MLIIFFKYVSFSQIPHIKLSRGEWGELGRGRSETTSVSDQPIGETTSFSHVLYQHGSSVGTSPLNGSLFRSPAAEISRWG